MRVFYTPDPRRTAIQLMRGKKGDDRPHDKYVPTADGLYDERIEELRKEC
ncbi:MAG: benzoate transporter [Caldilineaceae bacterium SB0665_bin_25]|nr:benzoate transporter [Caldilineaceae bacterium SB0665_bin_25]